MHAFPRPSSKPYLNDASPVSSAWRKLGLISILAAALLSACGGGGGGGNSVADGNSSNGQGASGLTYNGDFPVGMALASPDALADSSTLIAGGLGIIAPSLSMNKTLQQGVWASQADAVATGRLNIASSGLLSASALFDTSARTDASCYGPAVAYVNHDDSSTSGTLPAGSVAMWKENDTASSLPCGAAQLKALTGTETAQIQQAMLLTSAMHHLIAGDPSHLAPSTASPVDMTSQASSLFTPLLSGVTVNSATVSLSTDPASGASRYTYRLVLTRGSGGTAQSVEIKLMHTNDFTDLIYLGTLQITTGYLTSDATLGCTDQMSGGLYKVAKLTSLAYNRHYNTLSLRAKRAQYCGNPTIGGGSHMAELAAINSTDELDAGVYLTSSTRGSTLGWRKHFSAWAQDVDLSEATNDFIYMWQDQPDAGGNGYARLFGGKSELDLNTQTRSLSLYHGVAEDISTETYALQGFICNVNGPGSTHTVQPMFQYQTMTLSSGGNSWVGGTAKIAYAPTNSCNASASMSYDVNGTLTMTSTTNQLQGLTTGNADVIAQLNDMGLFDDIELTH